MNGKVKIKDLLIQLIFFLFIIIDLPLTAQLSIENGVSVPSRDTLYTLIVYAEVDFSQGGCPNDLPDNLNGPWPKDEKGKTLLPENANYFFDAVASNNPKGAITHYYQTASFNQYIMLGDYLPEVISLPCSEITNGGSGLAEISKKVNELFKDSLLESTNGIPLKYFDRWTPTPAGQKKIKQADGKIDLLYIIWRNNRFITGPTTLDYSGYGVALTNGDKFLQFKGVNNSASFNCTIMNARAEVITIAEHLHGIYGGNHWHSGGGRGQHTFMMHPASWGLTGQFGAAMQTPCGWDRWMINWKPADKKHFISALNNEGKEIDSDLIIDTNKHSQIFVLRDFISSGDAVRIKLPHINWQKDGDVKNQYLWLENHQMKDSLDRWCESDCNDTKNGEYPKGTPGIYAYIQVGKDVKEGGSEIYSGNHSSPNGLAGWMYPLSAEGNYDFDFVADSIQEGRWLACNWMNPNIPINKTTSLPNAFTGFNDLGSLYDSNHDSILLKGDQLRTGLSEIEDGKVVHHRQDNGDWEDAFSFRTQKTEISLSTNPAAVPVYTYTSDYEYSRFFAMNGNTASYENRSIWLNGINIHILEERNNGDIVVEIKWDDYQIKNDVRWCGNIVLSKNDFDEKSPSLLLQKRKTITLSIGNTPVLHTPAKNNPRYMGWNEHTVLKAEQNAVIQLKAFSKIIVEKDCTLELQEGVNLKLGWGAKIIIQKGGNFIADKNIKINKSWFSGFIKE